MIGTICPLVQEARRLWWRSTALYILGSLAGGSLMFTCIAFLGHQLFWRFPVEWRLLLALLAAVFLAVRELGVLKVQLPMRRRSVPRNWWMHFGPSRGAFAYGFVLGLGFSTIIPVGSFYMLGLWTALIGSSVYGMILGSAYGLARALPVVIVSCALTGLSDRKSPRRAVTEIADSAMLLEAPLRNVNGSAMISFAGMILGMIVILR